MRFCQAIYNYVFVIRPRDGQTRAAVTSIFAEAEISV
jgi:hypothetical protein